MAMAASSCPAAFICRALKPSLTKSLSCHSCFSFSLARASVSRLVEGIQRRYAGELAAVDVEDASLCSSPPQCSAPLRAIGKRYSMVSALRGDVRTLWRMMDERRWDSEMEKGLRESGIALTDDCVTEVIKTLPEAKQALRFFIWVGEQGSCQHNRCAVGAICRRWSHENQFQMFLDALDKARNKCHTMTSATFYDLVMGYCWAGMVDKAIETLERMKDYGCYPDAKHFNCLLAALVKEKQLFIVPKVHQRMLEAGFSPDSESFKTVINGLCKVGKTNEAYNLYNEMKAKLFPFDIGTCAAMVDSLCKSERFLEAFKLSEEMVQSGCPPSAQTYGFLANGLCKQGKTEEAYEVLYGMVNVGSVPNLVTITTVFNDLCDGGKVDKALELWNKINKHSTPTLTFHSRLVDALCKAERITEAEQVFQELKDRGAALSHSTYEVMIHGFCNAGEFIKACGFLFGIAEGSWIPDAETYDVLIQGLCKVGNIAEATRVVQKMTKEGRAAHISTYHTLMDGLCKMGDLEGAFNCMGWMKEIGCLPDAVTYKFLICTLCKADKVDAACKLLQQMVNEGCDADAVIYDMLNDGLRKLKKEREIETKMLWDEMKTVCLNC